MHTVKFYGQLPGVHNFANRQSFIDAVIQIAGWAEEHGLTGALVFFNHGVLDPWAVSSVVLHQTRMMVPLVAVQPYMYPPYTAAKMIRTLSYLYDRRIDVNMITGTVPREFREVGDGLDHEQRYRRLHEYVTVLRLLLESEEPITFDGEFYRLSQARFQTFIPHARLRPRIFVAGSSEFGVETALRVADVLVTHPGPVFHYRDHLRLLKTGNRKVEQVIRLELIARRTAEEAWAFAKSKYPYNRQSEIQLVIKSRSESRWNRTLAELALKSETYDGVYWLGGYIYGETYCPALVGSYEDVARYLYEYIRLGVTCILIGSMYTAKEFAHFRETIDCLRALGAAVREDGACASL